jgi:fructose-bisphosphate aldolase class 1
MLNISLDEEAERYLVEILRQERTTSSELIKKLLREHFQSVQPKQSVLERMGGIPQHLVSDGNFSDRDTRREIIVSRIKASQQQT